MRHNDRSRIDVANEKMVDFEKTKISMNINTFWIVAAFFIQMGFFGGTFYHLSEKMNDIDKETKKIESIKDSILILNKSMKRTEDDIQNIRKNLEKNNHIL